MRHEGHSLGPSLGSLKTQAVPCAQSSSPGEAGRLHGTPRLVPSNSLPGHTEIGPQSQLRRCSRCKRRQSTEERVRATPQVETEPSAKVWALRADLGRSKSTMLGLEKGGWESGDPCWAALTVEGPRPPPGGPLPLDQRVTFREWARGGERARSVSTI